MIAAEVRQRVGTFAATNYRLMLVAALLTLVAIYWLTLPYAFDESYFGEYVYFLAKDGRVRSEMFRGFLNYEDQVFVYHKLFVWLYGVLLPASAVGLKTLKTLQLGWLVALAGAMWRCTGRHRYPESVRWLAVALLVSSPAVLSSALIFRPEAMVSTLGFISFMALLDGGTAGLVVGGVFAGLAILTHLNGLMYLCAGAAYLMLTGHRVKLLAFLVPALAVGSLYLADVAWAGRLADFPYLFSSDIGTLGSTTLHGKLSVCLIALNSFFHSPEQITLTLLGAGACLGGYRYRASDPVLRALFTYVGSLLIFYVLLNNTGGALYLVFFAPFFALGMAAAWYRAPKERSRPRRWAALVYLGAVVITMACDLHKFQSQDDVVRKSRSIARAVGETGVNVLAPQYFVFDQIQHYRIQSMTFYSHHDRTTGLYWNWQRLLADAGKKQIKYLVFDEDTDEFRHFTRIAGNGGIPVETPGFERILHAGAVSIYRAVAAPRP